MNEEYIVNNFWEEFLKLQAQNPRMSLGMFKNENSDFTNFTDGCKDCYLIMNAWDNRDCMYSRSMAFSEDSLDCSNVKKCTLAYECVDCAGCYNCVFLQASEDCRDCEYGYDLKGCSNCFGCVGLRHKEFYVFNQPYGPGQYREEVSRLREAPAQFLQKFQELQCQTPRLFADNVNCENCVGDHIRNSKDCFNCYELIGCRDCFHCMECVDTHDMCDVEFGEYGSFNYECISAWKLHNSQYCTFCWESSDLEYCENVFRSEHCFGCVFLNHKEYHILNKPYSREEYFRLKEKIQAKMREDEVYGRMFLPSTYPLEDTVAHMKI